MNFEFKLPDIGEGLTEGEIVKWHVKEGDMVQEHQTLASVLTDKAEVEIPSPKAGKVVKLHGKPGEKIKVHATLVTLDAAGASNTSAGTAKPAPAPKAAPASVPAHPAPSAGSAGEFVFNLPDIGEGLVEGELVKWHVKEGQAVQEHEPIAAVLTDKAEVEIPSPKTGKIAKLHAKPGQKVKVHGPLVTFTVAGGASAPSKTAAASAVPAASQGAAPSPARARAGGQTDVLATPMIRKMAKDMGIDLLQVPGSGPQGRVLEADVRNFKPGNGGTAAPSYSYEGINATPAVKALAAQLRVDLSRVRGSGPGGRVIEPDVRAAAPASAPAPARPSSAPAPAAAPAAASHPPIPRAPEDKVQPFSGIRRKIAEKMVQSKRAVADVTHMDECDMTALQALRAELKKEADKRKTKLTFLPFIIRALSKTVSEFPMFNSALDESAQEIVIRAKLNVGIAVAAPQGLLVPNIKDAGAKDLWTLAGEIAALAEKVRAGKIDLPSLQGGTFTITNIGPIGGLWANPIVNHPEVAILGLLKLQKRPVVRDDEVVIREMMNLVLSFDHRVVDGADAAQFMNTLIKHLENPRTLL